jgi:AcrR family transcriptional regulator
MEYASSKHETILKATLALIQEHGLNELTTAKIARDSGTAETIIYRNFVGKREIITELLQRVGTEFQYSAEAILSASISPLEKLERLTEFYLNFIQQTHGMHRIPFS